MNICLIPARSGSKRIKNKNIKSFFGKPLIYYSIDIAKKSKLFDKIIVSTNSKKISKISLKYGAETPFLRPKNFSNDYATDYDVISHFLSYCQKNKIKISKLCYIYPTNPLLNIGILKQCLSELNKKKCQRVITIGKFPHPIQRALKKNKNGNIEYLNKYFANSRSQDLENYFFDAAKCYWFNFKRIKKFKKKLTTRAVEINRELVCDVDNMQDFNFLKKLYKLNK